MLCISTKYSKYEERNKENNLPIMKKVMQDGINFFPLQQRTLILGGQTLEAIVVSWEQ